MTIMTVLELQICYGGHEKCLGENSIVLERIL